MKDIELIAPYVQPDVPSCPSPLLIQRIRLAAIEFCRRTSILTDVVVSTSTAEQTTCSVALDQHSVIKLNSVTIAGSPVHVPPQAELNEKIAKGDTGQFAWLDGSTVHLNNALTQDDQRIAVEVVRIPSLDCTELADILVDEHAEAIGFGALHRLHGMPEKDWTNPAAEIRNELKFKKRCSTVSLRQSRANGSGLTRATVHGY